MYVYLLQSAAYRASPTALSGRQGHTNQQAGCWPGSDQRKRLFLNPFKGHFASFQALNGQFRGRKHPFREKACDRW